MPNNSRTITSSHVFDDFARNFSSEVARNFEGIQEASIKSSQATKRLMLDICNLVQVRALEAAGIFSGVTTSICRQFGDSSIVFIDYSLKSAEAICDRVQKRSVESLTSVGRSLKSAAYRFDAKTKLSVQMMSQLLPHFVGASAIHSGQLIGSARTFAHNSHHVVKKIGEFVVDRATTSKDRLNSSILLASESLSNMTVQTTETALLRAGISVSFNSSAKENVSLTPSSLPMSNEDDCLVVPVPTTSSVVEYTTADEPIDPLTIPTTSVFLKGGKVMTESLLENTQVLKAATHSAASKLDESSHKLKAFSQAIGNGLVDDGAAKKSIRNLKTKLEKSRRDIVNFVGRAMSKTKAGAGYAIDAAQSNINRTRQAIGQCAQRSISNFAKHTSYGFNELKTTIAAKRYSFGQSASWTLSRIEKETEPSKRVIRQNLSYLQRATIDVSTRTISNFRRGTALSLVSLKKNVSKIPRGVRSTWQSIEVSTQLHFDEVTNVRLAQMDRRLSSMHTLNHDQLPILWERSKASSTLFRDQLIRQASSFTTASMIIAKRNIGVAGSKTRRFATEKAHDLTRLINELFKTTVLLGSHLSTNVVSLSALSGQAAGKMIRHASVLAVDSFRRLLVHTVYVLSTTRVVIFAMMKSAFNCLHEGIDAMTVFCTDRLRSVSQHVSRILTMIVLKFQGTINAINGIAMALHETLLHDLVPNTVANAANALRETKIMFVFVLRFLKSAIASSLSELQTWPRQIFDFLIELRQRESLVVHQIAHDLDMVLEQNPREAIRWLRQNGWRSYVKQQQSNINSSINDDVDVDDGVSQQQQQQQLLLPKRPWWYS